jgi:hypothetical protein
MKFMESLRFHDMAWAAQTVNGETAITMAENRASRLREADARDDEVIARRYKDFSAYEAKMSHDVSRARRRFTDRFGFTDRFEHSEGHDRDRFEKAAKHRDRFAKEAEALVDDWFERMEDDRERMSCESANRHAEVERLDRLDMEEEKLVFLFNKANQRRIDLLEQEEEDRIKLLLDNGEQDRIKAVQTSLAEQEAKRALCEAKEDRIAEADSKPLEASKADEGSQDLQIAQGKGNMEGNLKITQGMDGQQGNAGLVFYIQFKILAAMLEGTEQQGAAKVAMLDGSRATRCIQDALLRVYDPGGQLYSV